MSDLYDASGKSISVRNQKHVFGFLNTAQDGTDIEGNSLKVLKGVDLDALALGTVKPSNYKDSGSPKRDWSKANILSDEFTIKVDDSDPLNPIDNIYVNDTKLDDYLTPPPIPSVKTRDSKGTIDVESGEGLSVSDVDFSGPIYDPVNNKSNVADVKITILPGGYTESGVNSYEIVINDDEVTFTVTNSGKDPKTFNIDGVQGTTSGFHLMHHGLYIALNCSFSYAAGNDISFESASTLLPDGEYSYAISYVEKVNGADVESVYSDVDSINIENIDPLGKTINHRKPYVVFNRKPDKDIWLYRLGSDDIEWSRILIVKDDGTSDEFAYIDSKLTSSIIHPKIIDDIDVRGVSTDFDTLSDGGYRVYSLLDSVDGSGWAKIFEKDNRLWAVPISDKNVVFYSEPLQWWKWTKTNSIGFNAKLMGVESIRDDKNVYNKNTSVMVTTKGLYNIIGSGSESEPYVRIEHDANFGILENGITKCNNVIYMVSNGGITDDDSNYDSGEWGNKLYSYNLTSLTELSAIVKNSAPWGVGNFNNFSRITAISGNKLKLITKSAEPDVYENMLMYHILSNGFCESSIVYEMLSEWDIETKDQYPAQEYSGKFSNSDRIRITFAGSIKMIWVVDGVDVGDLTFQSAIRETKEISTPNVFGKTYSIRIEGRVFGSDTIPMLYELLFVKEA